MEQEPTFLHKRAAACRLRRSLCYDDDDVPHPVCDRVLTQSHTPTQAQCVSQGPRLSVVSPSLPAGPSGHVSSALTTTHPLAPDHRTFNRE